MSHFPYRAIHGLSVKRSAPFDLDLLPVLAILWLVSLIQIISALSSGKTFGTEDTLAALTVLLVPVLAFRRSQTRGASAAD